MAIIESATSKALWPGLKETYGSGVSGYASGAVIYGSTLTTTAASSTVTWRTITSAAPIEWFPGMRNDMYMGEFNGKTFLLRQEREGSMITYHLYISASRNVRVFSLTWEDRDFQMMDDPDNVAKHILKTLLKMAVNEYPELVLLPTESR